ncbi:hypothetical protein ES708_25816 [subsurface metagenome]
MRNIGGWDCSSGLVIFQLLFAYLTLVFHRHSHERYFDILDIRRGELGPNHTNRYVFDIGRGELGPSYAYSYVLDVSGWEFGTNYINLYVLEVGGGKYESNHAYFDILDVGGGWFSNSNFHHVALANYRKHANNRQRQRCGCCYKSNFIITFLLRCDINTKGSSYRYGETSLIANLFNEFRLPPFLSSHLSVDPGWGAYSIKHFDCALNFVGDANDTRFR